MIFNKLNQNKGSLSVEAAIIVPVVFLSVIAILNICLLLYQQVHVQTLANKASERGAAVWNSPSKDMFIGMITKEQMLKSDLYWRIFDTKKIDKGWKISKFTNFHIGAFNAIGAVKTEIKPPELVDYIVYKKLRITIERTYKVPGGGYLKLFGMNGEFKVTASSEAVINEPVEFIRNTDFLIDTAKEVDNLTGGNVQKFGDKIKDLFGKLTGKLKDFIN